MIVTYHGEGFIKLQTGDTVVAMNPIAKKSGKKVTRFGSDVCLISANLDTMNGVDEVTYSGKSPFLVNSPGEYDIKGIAMKAIETRFVDKKEGEKVNTIFTFPFDNIKVCMLGHLGQKLDGEVKDKIGAVDMLFVPVGEGDGLVSAQDAQSIANGLDAKIIIPILYNEKTIPQFLKAAGAAGVTPIEKLTIKKKEVDSKEGEVILLHEI
jgi:L-ascorbate metabolism protein UlaG (beta-lactamase superfamily)